MKRRSMFKVGCPGAILLLVLTTAAGLGRNLDARRPAALVESRGDSPQQTITWETRADSLGGQNGQRFTLVCPGNGTLSSRVWGTDVYTDDSSICTAAVHAGLITTGSGGIVVIEIRPGLDGYSTSTRNGVTSRSYGSWRGSFAFVEWQTGTDRVYATWGTQADSLNGVSGQRVTIVCPGGGTLSTRIWGTDLYTNDSSICTGAVHAGLITPEAGGVVTIELRPGASSYEASTRNGVASGGYGSWGGSFVFVR